MVLTGPQVPVQNEKNDVSPRWCLHAGGPRFQALLPVLSKDNLVLNCTSSDCLIFTTVIFKDRVKLSCLNISFWFYIPNAFICLHYYPVSKCSLPAEFSTL